MEAHVNTNSAFCMGIPTSNNRGINWLMIPVIIKLSNPRAQLNPNRWDSTGEVDET